MRIYTVFSWTLDRIVLITDNKEKAEAEAAKPGNYGGWQEIL